MRSNHKDIRLQYTVYVVFEDYHACPVLIIGILPKQETFREFRGSLRYPNAPPPPTNPWILQS